MEEKEKLTLTLMVTQEEEYDPLRLKTTITSNATKKSPVKKEKGLIVKELEPTKEGLLELFKFLQEVGTQTLRTADVSDVTDKQNRVYRDSV